MGGRELMAQVLEFNLPDLGEGLTEAEIVRWLVEVGDVVVVDQPGRGGETGRARGGGAGPRRG
ncbi:biotin/lipoyl-containing protein, partial [Streptomyces pilosus]